MRRFSYYILLIGLLGCSSNSKAKKEISPSSTEKINTASGNKDPKDDYKEIVLSENRLDTFSIPFPKGNTLRVLKNHFTPFQVENKLGQQDGPDFRYILISKDKETPVAYLNFNSENEFELDEIKLVNPLAIDQYGVRVGDTYRQVLSKRKADFKNSTNYHQHTYLYTTDSNIYYELLGDFVFTEEMLENLKDLELTEEQLEMCKVESIIWRKKS